MSHNRLLSISAAVLAVPALLFAGKVEVINHHDFAVQMPWTMKDPAGKGETVLINVPPAGRQVIDTSAAVDARGALAVTAGADKVTLSFNKQDLGHLDWSVVLHDVDAATAKGEAASQGRPEKFKPQPLKLAFKESGKEKLFATWSAETTAAGLRVKVELDVYPVGYLDVRTTVTNESAATKNVYAAVLTHWTTPNPGHPIVDYNNSIQGLEGSTPWRKPGERHQFVARGVNWILNYVGDYSVVWLNRFAPSFTVHHAATAKTPAQWVGANSPQLDQEAYTEGNTLTHVTELAHGSVRSYRSRLDDYVLPDKSQPLSFTHRLSFAKGMTSDTDAANAFVAYTTYNEQRATNDQKTLHLGTEYVTFGTAYFPFSTLGENFVRYKLPGMSQDSYWPLAADVVKQYKLFADDIRRDLRIAKAMGFETIRLHHMEMLWTSRADAVERSSGGSTISDNPALQITAEQRTAFLDFFFAELKHVGLTALLDVKIKPKDLGELVQRYREQINGVEIDNEVLIFGMKDEDIPYWKECYAAVKAVAPDVRVHWTAHTNTGAFKRLAAEGVPHDRLGAHAYMDGESALTMARDFSLQVASYASAVNKPPVITEWNWRFLTRLTEENRAKVYEPIFGNVLKARSMPEVQQFQFNDSLAMSPLTLKGIRHYELLNLSRRPKAEAAVFQRLVDTYSAPDSTTRTIKAERQVVQFEDGKASVTLPVTNTSGRRLKLAVSYEGPPEVSTTLRDASIVNDPDVTSKVTVDLKLKPDSLPGFYHAFVRLEDKENHVLRYAWIEARNVGQPTFDKTTHPEVAYTPSVFDLDLTKPTAVVYGDDCPILELEAAWAVYQTLEAATGQRVFIFTARELPKTGITNVIYVGTPKSLKIPALDRQSVTRLPDSNTLMISGATSQDATLAAMDYTLRYWKTAKDAACRRVPLVEREIPKGGDAAQLP